MLSPLKEREFRTCKQRWTHLLEGPSKECRGYDWYSGKLDRGATWQEFFFRKGMRRPLMGNDKDTTVTKRTKMPQAGDEEFESELRWDEMRSCPGAKESKANSQRNSSKVNQIKSIQFQTLQSLPTRMMVVVFSYYCQWGCGGVDPHGQQGQSQYWMGCLALSRTYLNQQHDQEMGQNFTWAYLNWRRFYSIEKLLSRGSQAVIQWIYLSDPIWSMHGRLKIKNW